jgi:hypothetical protein
MRFIVTVVVTAIAAQASAWKAVGQDQPMVVGYWHVWTDKDGVSHQDHCELHNFALKSMEPPASPQWQDRMGAAGSTVIVTVQPVGWEGIWHQNPRPQWIVPLSGRWFVQTMDGKRVEMGSGEISFGEDQNTKPNAQGRKGHLSGTVGSAPAVLMVVQMASEPTVDQPCHLK